MDNRSSLHAPWRMDYILSVDKSAADGKCFLCQAAEASEAKELAERLVLWTTEHSTVLINRFPYTNGHLLVSPRAHKADIEELTEAELVDLQLQMFEAIKLLKRALSPQGFNTGMNLGRCAGAGVPGHLHLHVVPRWAGDTNFMSVVGEVRIVPQAVSQLYEQLMCARREMVGKGAAAAKPE